MKKFVIEMEVEDQFSDDLEMAYTTNDIRDLLDTAFGESIKIKNLSIREKETK